MGHDEDKNNFDTGGTSTTPVTPNPRATITGNNRLGMRPSRNVSAAQAELDRISKESNPNAIPASDTGDIVLNNPAPKGKTPKIMIIGIVVIVALVAVLVGLIITKGGIGGNSKGANDVSRKEINELLEANLNDTIEFEEFVIGINNSELNGEAIFNKEAYSALEKDLASAKALNDGLSKHKKLNNDENTNKLVAAKNRLSSDVSKYEKVFNIYKDYYEALTEFKADPIQKYLSGDQNAKIATEAYIGYINNKAAITNTDNLITQTNCQDLDQVPKTYATNCITLYTQRYQLGEAFYNYDYVHDIFKSTIGAPNSETLTAILNDLKARVEE